MDSTIFSKTIHFPLAPKHSRPEILKGSSHFTSLPAIFAILMTGQCRGDGQEATHE